MKKILIVTLTMIMLFSFMSCSQPNIIKIPEPIVISRPTSSHTPEPMPIPLLGGNVDSYSKAVLKLDYEAAYTILMNFIDANPSDDLSINIDVRDKLLQAIKLAKDYVITVDEFEGTGSIILETVAAGDGFAKYGFNQTGFYIAYLRVGYSVVHLNGIKVKVGEGDIIEYLTIGSSVKSKEIKGLDMYSESVWINTTLDELKRIAHADSITVRLLGDSNEDQEVDKADIGNINSLYDLYVIHLELLEYENMG